ASMTWSDGGQPDHLSFAAARKGGGGGSSSGAPGYSMQTTSLPDWIQAPAQQAISQATTLANRPVETNPYEQVAPVTADQTQAYQQIRDLQGSTAPAFS